MKIIKAASGKKTIKMSKSEWETIGKKAGWITAENSILDEAIDRIKYLLKEEEQYKLHKGNIPTINEPDYDEPGDNYVPGMSGEDYQDLLADPYVDILYAGDRECKVYFAGNYAPNSVNAGQESRHYIDHIPLDTLNEFKQRVESLGVNVFTSEKTDKAYQTYVA